MIKICMKRKKLKNELRSIQKKYSFLPQNGKRKAKGGHTALYKATLENLELMDVTMIYKGDFNTKKGQHWGSRIVFDNNNYLYFTIGDRGNRDVNPQDISRDGGKVYRLNLDGSVPNDNPFIGKRMLEKQFIVMDTEIRKEWYLINKQKKYGLMNMVQKVEMKLISLNLEKIIVVHITYGINYSGTIITDKTSMDGLEQPLYYWVPSIAPSEWHFQHQIYIQNGKTIFLLVHLNLSI